MAESNARQLVKLNVFKLDPLWRRLPQETRADNRRQFSAVVDKLASSRFIRSFGLVELRGDADFLLWEAADSLEQLQESARASFRPGKKKTLVLHPFVKTREWYLLPQIERQCMMEDHFRIGHEYPTVKINASYSFGLDDQEFMVAFETDSPFDFLDLVMELKGTVGSRYTLADTPIFTFIRRPIQDTLESLRD